ncbi:hypothetical protein [Pelagibacterium xiamenense]|uniref:hypothetical protein n=1 Tax=Pelagibacterium xiamenense TaxID=2901140 RepID=UPI001E354122|nr:hypothetical protein [Pelagibacterium xiamenense]MCD7060220.1 hypothetical protein [Pelagibacterium xiamenense]
MTYLDPNQTRSERVDIGKWIVRVLAGLILVFLGWYAFTVGTDRHGSPEIVSNPGDVQTTESPLVDAPPLAE